jgi:tetratricopeptide (TPR) repeat protein
MIDPLNEKAGDSLKKYKICVYAICKDEEQFVHRWMDAVGEADLVVVLDTGSSDHTADKLRERGAAVYTDTVSPWRFDTARNQAMEHIPEDVDICVSNDMDEVFEPGWRQKLEAVWQPQYTRARYLFTWSYNRDGSPAKQFAMEKIHRRHGFRWVHPVHEVLAYNGQDPEQTVWVPGMVLNHYPDLSKPRAQYLPLLELSAKENPDDDRTAFWLGREYLYKGQYAKCISELKRHLELPSARWDEERCASMRLISRSCQARGDNRGARQWLYRALAECPRVREPYLDLARLGYLEQNWPLVFLMSEKALVINEKSGSYLMEPESWGYALYDYGAIAAYRLGLYHKAYALAEDALSLQPDDVRLQQNLALIKARLDEEEAAS